MYHHHHYTRRQRIALFLTALAFFAATSAGLHALSDQYGWRHGPWGAHHAMGDHSRDGWDAPRDATPKPNTPKPPSSSIAPL